MILRPGEQFPASIPSGVAALEIHAGGNSPSEIKVEVIEGKLIISTSVFQEENWRERFFQLLEKS